MSPLQLCEIGLKGVPMTVSLCFQPADCEADALKGPSCAEMVAELYTCGMLQQH